MVYFKDLGECSAFGAEHASKLRAVGWLDKSPRSQPDLRTDFVEKLVELQANAWQPKVSPGIHRCPFCRITGGPGEISLKGHTAILGRENLFIPSEGVLYVAPSLLLHYMDSHEYTPPTVFQEAVLACPPMRSTEYFRAIIRNGPQGFASQSRT